MAAANGQSCVPPGFRFHPTDEELLHYYLRKKVSYEMIDLNVIRDVDLNKLEPWDLHETCKIGSAPQDEWYFFSHKDKKYPTGTRTNRATAAGFWKATGRDKIIFMDFKRIGMRKTLVFYTGRAPHGQKTEWIMHEYRLDDKEKLHTNEDGWVVCRVFKKRMHTKDTKDMNAERERSSPSANDEERTGHALPQLMDFPSGQQLHQFNHQQLDLGKPPPPAPRYGFSHDIFAQMSDIKTPEDATCNPSSTVIKSFIPQSLLHMNISRRPQSINMLMGYLPDQEPQTKLSTANEFREDRSNDWTLLDSLMQASHVDQAETNKQMRCNDHPQTLDGSSHGLALGVNRYDNNHYSSTGIEYWNFEK